jgi:hypothetical protein
MSSREFGYDQITAITKGWKSRLTITNLRGHYQYNFHKLGNFLAGVMLKTDILIVEYG